MEGGGLDDTVLLSVLMTIYISPQKTTDLHFLGENEEYVSPLEPFVHTGLSRRRFPIFTTGPMAEEPSCQSFGFIYYTCFGRRW